MTVSLALRGSNRVSKTRTEQIQAVARELGYSKDPMLSALCSYRVSKRKRKPRNNIYFIQTSENPRGMLDRGNTVRDYWNGAILETARLGYNLDKVWLGDPALNADRMRSILKARATVGLLVYQADKPMRTVRKIMDDFSIVSLGDGPKEFGLHSVRSNRFSNMGLVWDKLMARGYRKAGLILYDHEISSNHGEWEAAHFYSQNKRLKSNAFIPSLSFKHDQRFDRSKLSEWLVKYRPDVVLTTARKIYYLLIELGYRIPQDIGYVFLTTEKGSKLSGLDQQCIPIAKLGVRLLDQLVRNRELGVPEHQQLIQINGKWNEGKTIRPPMQ